MEQAIITNDASASKWKPAGTSGRVVYSSEKSEEEKEPTYEDKFKKIEMWFITNKKLNHSEYMTEIRCSKLFEEINSLYNEIK